MADSVRGRASVPRPSATGGNRKPVPPNSGKPRPGQPVQPGRPAPGNPGKPGKKRKHRSPLWTKVLVVIGALVMVASVGTYAIVEAGLRAIDHSVTQANLLGPATSTQLTGNTISGPINLLIVGVDASGARTDSIIIAHIPASHDRVYLISLPRDTKVNVPGGGTNKINSTFSGGFANLATTIKLNYGITFNGALAVNFNGFKDIVTKLGGIDMYVDETTHSIHHGYVGTNTADHAAPYKIDPNSGVPICSNPHYTFDTNPDACTLPGIHEVTYPKGMYHFDAYDALDFVRCRDGLVGTDYGRQRHQQQFIKAVMEKAYAQGAADPTKLLGLVSSMSKAFTFDGHGISLSDWIFTLKGISPASVITIKTNQGQFVSAPGPSDGHGSEQGLNPVSVQLLNAVRDDNGSSDPLGQFAAAHPDWIAG